jgi:hypothetical protein
MVPEHQNVSEIDKHSRGHAFCKNRVFCMLAQAFFRYILVGIPTRRSGTAVLGHQDSKSGALFVVVKDEFGSGEVCEFIQVVRFPATSRDRAFFRHIFEGYVCQERDDVVPLLILGPLGRGKKFSLTLGIRWGL